MTQNEVRFEDLVGKTVRNTYGRPIGRIEDLRIEPDGEDYLVTKFLIGPLGRLARLRAYLGQLPTFRALGIGREPRRRSLPWHWLDLSDWRQPVLSTEEGRKGGRAEEVERKRKGGR